MKDLIKTAIRYAAIVLIVLIMSGCNTIASVGDLTQALGKDIKIVAEGTQARMARE